MEALEAIHTRRSIRKYQPTPIPEKLINDILAAAMMAPSAGNQQPWHYIVITERKILDTVPTLHPYAKMILEAPAAVLLCGDVSLEKHAGMWVQDCSAATQNFLLAAHAKGLGSVWLGIYPREDRMKGLRALLNLPGNIIPFSLMPLGYPDEQKETPDRFQKDRVHFNRW